MDDQLLTKFLKGEATPDECRQVETWLQGAPEAWLDEYMERQASLAPGLSAPEKAAFTETVMARLHPRKMRWVSAAAAVAGLLAAGWYLVGPSAQQPRAVAMVDVSVPAGKTGTVSLPDGSKVIMNAGSTLRYAKNFEGGSRTVTLSGEAYFDVRQDAHKPFIIRAGALSTRVLGTTFNISAYQNAARQTVTVLSGKVAVEDTLGRSSVTLAPNQQAVFLPASASLSAATVVNPDNEIAWQKGVLVFDETPLSEVVEKLSRRFGASIQLAHSRIAGCRFNGQFEKESLDVILDMITQLTGTRAEKKGDTIVLTGKGCAPGL